MPLPELQSSDLDSKFFAADVGTRAALSSALERAQNPIAFASVTFCGLHLRSASKIELCFPVCFTLAASIFQPMA